MKTFREENEAGLRVAGVMLVMAVASLVGIVALVVAMWP